MSRTLVLEQANRTPVEAGVYEIGEIGQLPQDASSNVVELPTGDPIESSHFSVFKNSFSAVNEWRHSTKEWGRKAVIGGAGVLAFLTGAGSALAARSQEASKKPPKVTAQNYPSIWNIVTPAWQQAQAETPPGWAFAGPIDQTQMESSIAMGAEASDTDPIKRVQIILSNHSKSLLVKITQQQARGNIIVGDYYNTDNPSESKEKVLSLDGNLFSQKNVSVTPMIKSKHRKMPRNWGRSTKLPEWDSISTADQVIATDGSYDPKGPIHTSTVKIKVKSAKLVRSGRTYVGLSSNCNLRDPSYDTDGGACSKVDTEMFRVQARHKKTTYVEGKVYKTGDIISRVQKAG